MTNKVALIGAGVMGSAIGTRLLHTRHALRVHDPDADRMAALSGQGAEMAASPGDAARGSDFVIASLNSAAIVRTAVFGDNGVVAGAGAGTVIIDMSSIDPASTRALAGQAASHGLAWVDAPLSGGAPKALLGELAVMAGGREEDVTAAYAVLQHLCSNYTHMGPAGAGQTTKLINQVLCALNFSAVAEATRLALDAGVDAARIPQAIRGGRADSAIVQEYMAAMATGNYVPTGRIDNMVKDLNGVQDLARETHTAMPLTAACAEINRLMLAAGYGASDNAELMAYWRDR